MTLELPIHKFSLKVAAISPFKHTMPLLLALVELSCVSSSALVVPDLLTLPVLCIIDPLASVSDALCRIEKCAPSSRLIKLPMTHVDVTIRLGHLPQTMEETILKEALITSTIWVKLNAKAVFLLGLN